MAKKKKKKNNTITTLSSLFKKAYGDSLRDLIHQPGFIWSKEALEKRAQEMAKRKHDKDFKNKFEEEIG